MQHPFPEIFVEQKIAETRREVERNILVQKTKTTNAPLQTWAINKMHDLSVWMMCTGERLHNRYHAQLPHLHQSSTQAR